jgi:methionyl-tRNA synthetase
LKIDIGNETRTIIAGIAETYTPEAMKGKIILVVANLKPAKIRGVESHGMLLAVSGEKGHSLITTDSRVKPGSKAK